MTAGLLLPKPEKYHYMRQWYARDRGATAMREIAEMVLRALGSRAERVSGAAIA
jgi:hypothetical protein